MTPGNISLGIPGNPQPPTWQEPPVGPHWPAGPEMTGNQFADFTASTLNDAKVTCRRMNQDLIAHYYGQMQAFWMSATSGKAGVDNPPTVPFGYGVVGPFGGGDDGSNAEYSWAAGMLGPVCPALPLPTDHTKSQKDVFDSVPLGTVDIGAAMEEGSSTGYFHVGPNDRVLPNKTISGTSADGVTGTFKKIPGVAAGIGGGWYLRVS